MFRLARMLVVPALAGFLLLPLGVSAQTGRAAPRKRAPHTAVPKSPPPETGTQAQPAPALTPEQMPAVPPQVTYRNGQLSIVAQNSSLRDILAAVRVQTGASLEMPPGVAGERAVVRLGPGAPRDVLAALLQGSSFDYILLGSLDNPNAVQRIILSTRGGAAPAAPPGTGTGVTGSSSPGNPPARPSRPLVRSMPPEQVEEPEAEEAPEPSPPPSQIPEEQAQPPSPPAPQVPGQPQVKTPQQLLQELQMMQQQQRPQKPVPPEQ